MAELQDIFMQYSQIYKSKHKFPQNLHKAIYCIESCRTSAMGGHVDENVTNAGITKYHTILAVTDIAPNAKYYPKNDGLEIENKIYFQCSISMLYLQFQISLIL